jgi:class 3 adenylate cyclase
MNSNSREGMKIREKLAILLVTVSTAAVGITALMGYRTGKASLTEAVERHLTAITRAKAYQIDSYFRTLRNHVITLSEDRMTIEAFRNFKLAYSELDQTPVPAMRQALVEYYVTTYVPRLRQLMDLRPNADDFLPTTPAAVYLQNQYIIKNPFPPKDKGSLNAADDDSQYTRVHRIFQPSFRKIVDQFGYYDLMLVQPEDHRVIYTVRKEPDFGTSLSFGPFRNSQLASVVSKSLAAADPDSVFIADFQAYEPSFGAPSAFMASPIYDNSKLLGVLVLQLSDARIDAIVSSSQGWEKDGLGKTGDSGIVGSDYLMRSTTRTFLENQATSIAAMRARGVPEKTLQRMEAYGTTILQLEVRLPSVTEALAGREGTAIQRGSSGAASLVSYMPLHVEGLNWAIATRISLSEALQPLRAFRNRVLRFAFLMLLLVLIVAFLMARTLVKPAEALTEAVRKMAAGDLKARVNVTSRDELGHLAQNFNHMADRIAQQTEVLEQKNRENEELLLNILPGPIATRLKSGESSIADNFAQVTVLFADIVGFTVLSTNRDPASIVNLLNGLFSRFDEAARRHGIEKIKTIGDAYMAVAGVPMDNADHAQRIIDMALDMLRATKEYAEELNLPISIRIGINSGPVVAGVIGKMKYIYDLWGDTVNVASRMESHGVPGAIQVTRAVYDQLANRYPFESRGEVEVKGKGMLETWLLRLTPSPISAATHQ